MQYSVRATKTAGLTFEIQEGPIDKIYSKPHPLPYNTKKQTSFTLSFIILINFTKILFFKKAPLPIRQNKKSEASCRQPKPDYFYKNRANQTGTAQTVT